MPHTIHLEPEGYTGLKPRTRAGHRALQAMILIVFAAIVGVGCLKLLQQHWQEVRQITWSHATGTIRQVKPILVVKPNSLGSAVMLYTVQVQAVYQDNGATKRRWITVHQSSKPIVALNFQTAHWVGKSCTVRWNPSNANQIDVEII